MAACARVGIIAVACSMWLISTACAGQEVVPVKLQAFDLKNVRLLDGPWKIAQEANRRYLHYLDEDRLLWTFRHNAGLPTPGEPLGGWEATGRP